MLRLSSQTQQSKVRAQLELLLRNAEPGERLPSEPALAKLSLIHISEPTRH